jgi:TolB-like protein
MGRVSQNGDAVVIRMELVDVLHGWQLWGECYDEKISNILSAQGSIAKNITRGPIKVAKQNLRLKLT